MAFDSINNRSGYFKDQRWLTAHNAWNTNQNPANNQSKTITELLDYGVRGLALDVYGDDEDSLHLQHGPGNIATYIKWSTIQQELKVWLASHPEEIVTLFFESYLEGPTADMIWNSPTALKGLNDSLEKIPCYRGGREAQEKAITNKTFSELIAETNDKGQVTGHRLFAFIEHEPDEGDQKLFPVMTKTFTESVYGDDSLDIQTWANLREDSAVDNELTFMNHFGDSPVASRWDGNDVAKVLKHVFSFMIQYFGRYPNFISLDEITWGNDPDTGPIQIMRKVVHNADVNIASFHWEKESFDDLVSDITIIPIVSFRVTNVPGQGIVKIEAQKEIGTTRPPITGIELISVSGYGIVNMRTKAGDAPWGSWLVRENEKDTDVNGKNITMGIYGIATTLTGIFCRTKEGKGVTDFAAASSPRLPTPPKKTFRENR